MTQSRQPADKRTVGGVVFEHLLGYVNLVVFGQCIKKIKPD
jgi:hypothetical protein